MITCAFLTFGCKVNQYETEAVREEILALGFEEAPPGTPADIYVVNACSVTGASGAKSRRAVLRIARENPGARILVMGCSSPREKELLRKIPQVAALVGNEEKGMVPAMIRDGLGAAMHDPSPAAPDRPRRSVLDLHLGRSGHRTRAYLKVQDGCNEFCSFCIIPYLRGRSRSRAPRDVLEEARRLAGSGCLEVVVTGVHLQDWGEDLDPPARLPDLLAALGRTAAEAGIRRLRLSSLGPGAITRDLAAVLLDPVFCPHWHVPLQSGDDGVLALMRRGYTREDFLAAVRLIEEEFSRPSITTDVLVGHPGETEEAFERTLETCRGAGFSRIHVFPFSPREGTRSARLPGRVPDAEVRRRERAVDALERELALAYKMRFMGEEVEVLFEGPSRAGAAEGYTERYLRVAAPADDPGALRNRLLLVRVERAEPDVLHGTILPANGREPQISQISAD